MPRLRDLRYLADENIHPVVVDRLRDAEIDVVSASEAGLLWRNDIEVLATAAVAGRVVITHDSDFGRLAVLSGHAVVGILYIRPGDIAPSYAVAAIDTALTLVDSVEPPFVVVVRVQAQQVTVRVRHISVSP